MQYSQILIKFMQAQKWNSYRLYLYEIMWLKSKIIVAHQITSYLQVFISVVEQNRQQSDTSLRKQIILREHHSDNRTCPDAVINYLS